MAFLKRVRRVDGFHDVPAVAITAVAHEEETRALLAAGFQRVVTKPILDPMKLHVLLDELLQVSSVVDQRGGDLDGNQWRTA
jgi:CheY-like chemotaxis protein